MIHTVEHLRDVEKLSAYLREIKCFGYDCETTGLNWVHHRAFMISFSDGKDAWVIPLKRFYAMPQVIPQLLRETIGNPACVVVGHNLKFDLHMTRVTFGVEPEAQLHDTLIMAFLLDENRMNGLKALVRTVLEKETPEERKVLSWLEEHYSKKDDYRYDTVPEEIMVPYSGTDPLYTMQLFRKFLPTISAHFNSLYETERHVMKILYKMERNGLLIDVKQMEFLRIQYEADVAKLRDTLFQQVGKEFNPNSEEEVGEILFKQLGLPIISRSIKTNLPETNENVLIALNHPMADLIREYRGLSHTLSTYIKGPLAYVDSKGYVHGTYSMTRAKTGRFSSSEPNVQNIPKIPEIRDCYIVEPGQEMWFWDQSQIEMVGFTHYSKDPQMQEALRNEKDLHQTTAAAMFNVPFDQVTPVQRQVGKGINFALIYGCGDKKLATFVNNYMPSDSKITGPQAIKFKQQYMAAFPRIQQFSRYVINTVRTQRPLWGNHVKNSFGRVRRLNVDKAYTGVNHLIQGWARDLIGAGMVAVDKALNPVWRQNIHDAVRIDLEGSASDKMEQVQIISKCLSDFPQFEIPIRVSVEMSKDTWKNVKKVPV